jgi:hypothetical protein
VVGAGIEARIALALLCLAVASSCVIHVRLYRSSKTLAPEEIGKEPVYSEQVGVWFANRAFSWPFARLTTYEGFFVLCVEGIQYVFTKENVVKIEPEWRRRFLGLKISHSLKFVPRTIIIRAYLVDQLKEVLWAALDSEYEHVY